VRRLVLASGSPRRRELLALLGVPFDVVPPDVDETPHDGEPPVDLVRRLACAKVVAVDGDLVLAADTIVELDGELLGKPADPDDARRMLRRLSARTHHVHTGVAVRVGERMDVEVVTTEVTFTALTAGAIDWYLATEEPLDKAGAYALQGAGGAFVERIDGSASNVVGLPLATVAALLGRVGVFAAGRVVT
jgi:septum formation protein